MTRQPGRTGWAADPAGRFAERLRVAGEWTQRVRVDGHEAIDPVDVDDPAPTPTPDPAGDGGRWEPDPADRFDQRWWDGRRWTRHVRSHGWGLTDASAPPTSRRPAGARVRTSGREPGWRADPDGGGQRWWDGHDWTAKRRDGPGGDGGPRRGGGWWDPRVVAWLAVLVAVLLGLVAAVVLVAT